MILSGPRDVSGTVARTRFRHYLSLPSVRFLSAVPRQTPLFDPRTPVSLAHPTISTSFTRPTISTSFTRSTIRPCWPSPQLALLAVPLLSCGSETVQSTATVVYTGQNTQYREFCVAGGRPVIPRCLRPVGPNESHAGLGMDGVYFHVSELAATIWVQSGYIVLCNRITKRRSFDGLKSPSPIESNANRRGTDSRQTADAVRRP